MMSMLQQQMSFVTAGRMNTPSGLSAIPLHGLPQPPPVPTCPNIPAIDLNVFCQRYGISDIDKERLRVLEFCPGDPIDTLSSDEWRT